MKLKITYLGHSYHASQLLPGSLELSAGATVDEALAAIRNCLGNAHQLPDTMLVVLSGRHLGTVARHDSPPLEPSAELVLIAPVAGG